MGNTKRKKDVGKVLLDKLLDSFRKVIKPYIQEYKASRKTVNGYWISDLSKKLIEKQYLACVDHVALFKNGKSFRELAYSFLVEENFDMDMYLFMDKSEIKALLQRWSEYHNQNAILQIVTSEENRILWLASLKKKRNIHWKKFYEIASNPDNPESQDLLHTPLIEKHSGGLSAGGLDKGANLSE